MLVTFFSGCRKEQAKPSPEAPRVSSIAVESQADGIHLKTTQAEFVLTSNGNLLAAQAANTIVTVDEPSAVPGVAVKTGEKAIDDFVRDLSHAEIREAQGKLGKTGKHIEVKGHSASTGLDEVLIV